MNMRKRKIIVSGTSIRPLYVIASVLTFLCTASHHSVAQQQRIIGPIDSSRLSVVPKNIPGIVQRAIDLGPAAGDIPLTGLTLRFNMTSAQQTSLTQLLEDQQNPASAHYHQWLTPEQFGAEFGLTSADLQKIADWLSSQGFTAIKIARGGLFIHFSGSVAQANSAFHAQIHQIILDGHSHIANLTDPQLPTSIAAATGAMTGLNDFHSKPHNHSQSLTVSNAAKPYSWSPAFKSNNGNSVNYEIAPDDFHTIYDESPLLAEGINGTGVSIAIVGQSDIESSDIANFRSVGGLPPNTVTQVLYGQDPGFPTAYDDEAEAELDLEWAGAAAPAADLIFANGLDALNDSLTGAIDNNLAPILSSSYGDCEADGYFSQSSVDTFYPLFEMASAQGQTIVADTGDFGATDCDYDAVNGLATQGLSVNFPASSPLVTAIGGTEFIEDDGSYWSSNGSALSYIPELAWNGNVAGTGFAAGGGGPSRYFTKPYWQLGNGIPSDSARDIPDVSMVVAPYLACIPGNCTNGYLDSSGNPSEAGAGTSFSTPAFAGILALVEQKTGGRLGNANPTIYALANSPYYSSVFHDVTTGSNASPCMGGTPDCPFGGSIGYLAGVGYDLATGWGSVDAFNLVNSWGLVTPLVSTAGQTLSATMLNGSTNAVIQGTAIILTATITSGSSSNPAMPTGTVQFLLDNVPLGTASSLSAGTATYSLNTMSIQDAHTVQAAYSGDATFSGSKGSFAITVTPTIAPALSITTLNGTSNTIVKGRAINFTAIVASGSNSSTATPTGSVQFLLDNVPQTVPILLDSDIASFSLDTTSVALGTHTVQAVYFGDTNFAGSQGSFAIDVTNTAPPDFTLSPSTTSVTANSGSSSVVTFTVTGLNDFVGNVQFSASTANAHFSSNPVMIGSTNTAMTSLTLYAYNINASGSLRDPSRRGSPVWYDASSGIALAGLLLMVLPKRRRFLGTLAAVLSIGCLAVSGCGGSGNATPPASTIATPPGSYTITVTAAGISGTTNMTHTATVTFIVQ
jgi:subtilase family serine protease